MDVNVTLAQIEAAENLKALREEVRDLKAGWCPECGDTSITIVKNYDDGSQVFVCEHGDYAKLVTADGKLVEVKYA